ncbi:MAG TPA: DUF4019 domain-containing protein [Steroidobacteraceae bacterium]|nr:DUF4019 domain-containing protein [Steroidobacteraceae bacterium]
MTTSLMLVSLLLLGMSILSLLLPWYTRPDLFFGVTVLPEFRRTAPARRIVRAYRAAVCGVAGLALVVVLALQHPVLALFVHILGTSVSLIAAHHAASTYASARASAVEVDLSAEPERMPGGPVAPLLPFVWLLGLGSWAVTHIALLPSQLIVHYGLRGTDRWVATTPRTVMLLVGLSGAGCLVIAATAYGVLHWSRRISTSGSAALSERQFRRLAVMLALAAEYLLSLLPLLMLLGAPRAWMRTWVLVLWLTLIVFFVRLVRAGQGGTRRAAPAGAALPVGDRTDDAHWVGGMLYVNRADRALFVEKRMGIGWTLNFGNLWAWLLLAGMLAIPLALRIALPHSRLDTPVARAQAQTAALAWLDSIDAGKYGQSWDTAATPFKSALSEPQWVSRIAALRERLGALKSRRISSSRFADSLPGAPHGEYVVIKFDTSFAHDGEATETVTPMKDSDGTWRVSGYYVK